MSELNESSAATVIQLPGTDDTVILLDPEQRPADLLPHHPFHNVRRHTSSGDVVWVAELVPAETTAKSWLGIEFDGTLRAWTYSWSCELDPQSGRITATEFTK